MQMTKIICFIISEIHSNYSLHSFISNHLTIKVRITFFWELYHINHSLTFSDSDENVRNVIHLYILI